MTTKTGRNDPSRCFYGDPGPGCICGYCRGWLADASPRSHIPRKECGHRTNVHCACIKYRSAPWPAS